MYKRPIASWLKHIDFIIVDLIALNLSFILAYYLRFHIWVWNKVDPIYVNIILVLSIGQVALSLMMSIHHQILKRGYLVEFFSCLKLAFADLVFASIYMFSLRIGIEYSRLVIYYLLIIFCILDYVLRLIWKSIIKNSNGKLNLFKEERQFVVLIEKEYEKEIVEEIKADKFSGIKIKTISLIDSKNENDINNFTYINHVQYSELIEYISKNWIDEIAIYLPNHHEEQIKFLSLCRQMGLTVHLITDKFNVSDNRSWIENIGSRTAITITTNSITNFQSIIKRTMDIGISLVGVIITAVMYVIIGPIIKLKSPGPIIYKQQRVGQNGKVFTMYKFRSMHVDADKRKEEYQNKNIMSDYMFKLDFDPRIIGNEIKEEGSKKTGIGQFIRKTSIDEFPQFINVLKGDMSVVGTRPPTVDEWNKYKHHHRARLSWKPGVTGLWQVSGRNTITNFEEVVALDIEYICNYRLITDLKIISKTILKIFNNKDAI